MNTGRIEIGRIWLAYRGFRIRPFIRRDAIRIGSSRLYAVGPIAVFVHPHADRIRGIRVGKFRAIVYDTADPAPRFTWNRYSSGVIGAAVKVGARRLLSVVWRDA